MVRKLKAPPVPVSRVIGKNAGKHVANPISTNVDSRLRYNQAQMDHVKELVRSGMPQQDVSSVNGVPQQTISLWSKNVVVDHRIPEFVQSILNRQPQSFPNDEDEKSESRQCPEAKPAPMSTISVDIAVKTETLQLLWGLAGRHGYSSLNEYVSLELIPGIEALEIVKDAIPVTTPEEFLPELLKILRDYARIRRSIDESIAEANRRNRTDA